MLFIPTCDMISPPQCPNRSRLVETFDAMMLEELNMCNFEDPLCHCKDQGPGEGFGFMTVEVLHVKPKMNVNPRLQFMTFLNYLLLSRNLTFVKK